MTTHSTIERLETVEKGMEVCSAAVARLEKKQSAQFKHLKALITSLFDKLRSTSNTRTDTDASSSKAPKPGLVTATGTLPAVPPRLVEIPTFQGDDPVDWLSRIEQYFYINPATDMEKIPIAMVAMEGAALHWVRWLLRRNPQILWPEFTAELLQRFDAKPLYDPFETLMETIQTGPVDEYVNEFVARMEHVTGLTNKHFRSIFLRGLLPDIKLRVNPNDAPDLFQAMQVARVIERRRLALQQCTPMSTPMRNSSQYNSMTHAATKLANSPMMTPSRVHMSNTTHSGTSLDVTSQPQPMSSGQSHAGSVNSLGSGFMPRGVRHLTHAEYIDRTKCKTCYHCDEPFSPLHVCQKRTLQVLIDAEDENCSEQITESTKVNMEMSEIPLEEEVEHRQLELSKLTAGGFDGPRTMKFWGKLHGQPTRVMIDSGASHCFISEDLAERLQLTLDKTRKPTICLGDGQRRSSFGFCDGLVLCVNKSKFDISCYVCPLGGVDIILGVSWLAKLGDVSMNWANMIMDFNWLGEPVQLTIELLDEELSRHPEDILDGRVIDRGPTQVPQVLVRWADSTIDEAS